MSQAAYRLEPVPELALLLAHEAAEPHGSLPPDVRIPPRLLQEALFNPLGGVARRPGKEFRGRLVDIAFRLAGGAGSLPAELPAALEALHLGSLIIDDIEDGSARRRGGQALHRLVGVPLALNAGNWLYFYPTVMLSRAGLEPRVELALRRAMDRSVLHCHYGQALDLSVRITELRRREVLDVVAATTRLKTGSLMELAAEVGALAANASPETVSVLSRLGRDLGVALQMLDDLTGITSERRCHKGHEDLIEARPSWVWAWLSEREDDVGYLRLRALAEQVVARDLHPEVLAEQLRERVADMGRLAVRDLLQSTLAELPASIDANPALGELRDEIARLERYDG